MTLYCHSEGEISYPSRCGAILVVLFIEFTSKPNQDSTSDVGGVMEKEKRKGGHLEEKITDNIMMLQENS